MDWPANIRRKSTFLSRQTPLLSADAATAHLPSSRWAKKSADLRKAKLKGHGKDVNGRKWREMGVRSQTNHLRRPVNVNINLSAEQPLASTHGNAALLAGCSDAFSSFSNLYFPTAQTLHRVVKTDPRRPLPSLRDIYLSTLPPHHRRLHPSCLPCSTCCPLAGAAGPLEPGQTQAVTVINAHTLNAHHVSTYVQYCSASIHRQYYFNSVSALFSPYLHLIFFFLPSIILSRFFRQICI